MARIIQRPLVAGAMLVIEVDTSGAQRKLGFPISRLSNLQPILQVMLGILRQEARQRFSEGGNPAWRELAPSTIMEKTAAGLPARTPKGRIPHRLKQNKQFGPANILIRTGALRDAWGRKGARGHIERIDAQDGVAKLGARIELPGGRNLAAIHQYGTRPYEIRVKFAKALRFTGSKGEEVLRQAVRHPGLAARPVTISDAGVKRLVEALEQYLGQPKEILLDAA